MLVLVKNTLIFSVFETHDRFFRMSSTVFVLTGMFTDVLVLASTAYFDCSYRRKYSHHGDEIKATVVVQAYTHTEHGKTSSKRAQSQ